MPIIYDEKKRVFKLDTPNTTYAFHVTNSNHLLHLYYGASIPETDITHMLRIPNDEPFVPSTHDGIGTALLRLCCHRVPDKRRS